MKLNCPRCGNPSKELIECESCKVIGCIRCITKHGKKWLCEKCKSGQTTEASDNVWSSMFS